jgi:hypothetical protein
VAQAPATIEFTPVSVQDEYSYQWDFGDSQTSSDRQPSHTYEDAGDFTVVLTISRGGKALATGRSQVRIEPGPAGWAVITPAQSELSAGQSQKFEVQAFDELGNRVSDATVTWSVDPDAGEITPDGTFTAALGLGAYVDGVTAAFERLGKTGTGKATVTLKPGPPAGLRVDPERIQVMAGGRLTLTPRLVDANGLPVPGGVTTFEALRSEDRIDPNGLFRVSTEALETDSDLVRVKTVAGDRTFEQVVRGIVSPGVLDQVIVTPGQVVLQVNGTASLSAAGFDRFGNKIKLDSVKWTLLTPDPGVITQDGQFTAGTIAGDFSDNYLVVQGSRDGVEASASVNLLITPGDAVTLSIVPKSDSVPAGAGAPFEVHVRDRYGNLIGDAQVIWEVNSAGGQVTSDGVFIAPFVPGDYPAAVRVTLPPRSLGNAAALSDTADVQVRPRSSDMLAVEALDGDGAGIFLIDLATSEISPLAESLAGNGAREFSPDWTADGADIVFGSDLGDELDIYMVDIATRTVRRLTKEPGGAVSPAISPDGSKLAYLSVKDDLWQVYVVPVPAVAGTGEPPLQSNSTGVKISGDSTSRHLLPSWSPDGRSLLYTRDDGLGSLTVIIADVETLQEKVLTPDGQNEVGFAWSADGTRVLGAREDENEDLILVVIDIASGGRTPVADFAFPVSVADWSPDGSELFVVDAVIGALWLADTDGTGLRQAVSETRGPRRAAWRPVALKPPS